ncbi:MAG: serine/threonine protein phosphatase [Pseudomonadota bacterium]
MKLVKALSAVAFAVAATGAAQAAISTNPNVVLSPICGNNAAISAEFISIDGASRIACELSEDIVLQDGDVLASSYFGFDVVWVLKDRSIVKIGDGDRLLAAGEVPASVNVTIEAGVQFRSEDASALVVTRGSTLDIQGTAEEPVVMASKDDNFTGIGEWGGLVYQGFGLTNFCGLDASVACNQEAEGVSFTDQTTGEEFVSYYGGYNKEDNSGTVSYLIIAESGFDVAGSLDPSRSGNEINGFTLVGVGSGTTISNVQIVNGLDDGIEFFGGDVSVSDIYVAGISDDSYDYDFAYNGTVTNGVAIQFGERLNVLNEVLADHVVEASNNDDNELALPLSNPTFNNFYFQSSGTDEALKFKVGAGGQFFLADDVVLGTDILGSDKGCIEITNEDVDRVASGELLVVSNIAECQVGDQATLAPVFPAPADFSWTLAEPLYR